MKRCRSNAGETLVETLVSVLIAALAFAILSTAAVTAARINAAARKDDSFHYAHYDLPSAGTGVTVRGSGAQGKTGNAEASLFENNGYYYYTQGAGT